MLRKIIVKLLIKFIIAFALIFWLFQSGRIDFSLLTKSMANYQDWALCFICILITYMIGTLRWKKILQLKSQTNFNFFEILKINWIGFLFNTILPGSVSGDFIKLVYARHLDTNFTKTFLVTSVVMDRIIGLFGMLFLLGLASLFNYNDLVTISSQLKTMIHFNFMIFAGMLTIISSILFPANIQNTILKYTDKLPTIHKQVRKTLEQVWLIGSYKKVFIENILLSMVAQIFFIIGFWIIASPFFETEIPFRYALTFMPLGLCTIAIPITPQGLGIGHAVFDTLFKYFGVNKGASLFNLYFVSTVTMNLVGIIPYLTSDHRNVRKEAENFENKNENESIA